MCSYCGGFDSLTSNIACYFCGAGGGGQCEYFHDDLFF